MIIFALDVNNIKEAKMWVDKLYPHIKFFKVGLESFLACGWDIIDYIKEKDCKVFLDLKLKDIPETVKRTVQVIDSHHVDYTTLHSSIETTNSMIAASTILPNVKLLGVTVLTSIDDKTIKKYYNTTTKQLVLDRAALALDCGCDGIVSSPNETRLLREQLGIKFIIVNPGIRVSDFEVGYDDQKRVGTAWQAMDDGATDLVIGRPIRDAIDPIKMVNKFLQEV